MKNILFVGAHPDDLELMAGGTVKRVLNEGGTVHALTVSNGTWVGHDSKIFRDSNIAIKEAEEASKVLGYSVEHLNEKTLEIEYKDSIVSKILESIESIKADTIICPWIGDLHKDHSEVAKMAIAASRKIPRVLMGQANWYIAEHMFTPNIFIDISETYDDKIKALECYESVGMQRVGNKYRKLVDSLSSYYGSISSSDRAEGFITNKFTL